MKGGGPGLKGATCCSTQDRLVWEGALLFVPLPAICTFSHGPGPPPKVGATTGRAQLQTKFKLLVRLPLSPFNCTSTTPNVACCVDCLCVPKHQPRFSFSCDVVCTCVDYDLRIRTEFTLGLRVTLNTIINLLVVALVGLNPARTPSATLPYCAKVDRRK